MAAAMSKSNKSLIFGSLFVLICGIGYLIWFTLMDQNQSKKVEQGRIESNSATGLEVVPRSPPRSEGNANEVSIEPLRALEEFDASMNELRNSRGDDWTEGLKKLAVVVNSLGNQPDFESLTASSLMIKAMSDVAITRLMTGEVPGDATLRALENIIYQVPTDEKLIDFICQYYADGEKERMKYASDSVLEFVSRFESDDELFPKEDWAKGWTMKGLITERKATLSLFGIAGAKQRLELARVTALYVARGGDFNLRGNELASEFAIRVGKEAALVSVPKFFGALGNLAPTINDISNDIGMVLYEQQTK